jgi:hypothetical protein
VATTITRTVPGTFDPETERWTSPSTTTIAGSAFQRRANVQRYAALGLSLATDIALFFTPSDYELRSHTDEFARPGDTVSWNGKTYTVRAVETVAPDGIVIAATLYVSA